MPRRPTPVVLLAGLTLIALGLLALVALHGLDAAAARGSMSAFQAKSISRAEAVATARRAARMLFRGDAAQVVYASPFTEQSDQHGKTRTVSGQQVLMLLGQDGKVRFAAMEVIGPRTLGLVGRTNESGWYIPFPPAAGPGVTPVAPTDLPAPLRGRVSAWAQGLGSAAFVTKTWPFSSGVLAVADLGGQTEAAFLPAAGGSAQVLLSPPHGTPETLFLGP